MKSKGCWIAISIAVLIAVGLITLFLVNSHQEVSDDLIVRVGYKPNSGYLQTRGVQIYIAVPNYAYTIAVNS